MFEWSLVLLSLIFLLELVYHCLIFGKITSKVFTRFTLDLGHGTLYWDLGVLSVYCHARARLLHDQWE